jgi:hypothetical protein
MASYQGGFRRSNSCGQDVSSKGTGALCARNVRGGLAMFCARRTLPRSIISQFGMALPGLTPCHKRQRDKISDCVTQEAAMCWFARSCALQISMTSHSSSRADYLTGARWRNCPKPRISKRDQSQIVQRGPRCGIRFPSSSQTNGYQRSRSHIRPTPCQLP